MLTLKTGDVFNLDSDVLLHAVGKIDYPQHMVSGMTIQFWNVFPEAYEKYLQTRDDYQMGEVQIGLPDPHSTRSPQGLVSLFCRDEYGRVSYDSLKVSLITAESKLRLWSMETTGAPLIGTAGMGLGRDDCREAFHEVFDASPIKMTLVESRY